MVRSASAVIAGFLAIAALSIGTNVALAAVGIFPQPGQPFTDPSLLTAALAYVAVYAVAGCYLTAALAPGPPMLHALVLGVLGLAFNVFGAVTMRGQVPDWYLAAGIALTMPYAWIGGKLREIQLARRGRQLAS